MNDLIIKTLADILVNNHGSKLTVELINGIIGAVNQALPKDAAPSGAVESDKL
jgi:hypothetical protein